MRNAELLTAVEQISRDRGVAKEIVFEMLEDAIRLAAMKSTDPSLPKRDLRLLIDKKTGELRAHARLTVVSHVRKPTEEIALQEARKKNPGAMLNQTGEFEIDPSKISLRIVIEATRQMIKQNMRKQESAKILQEFKKMEGDLVVGSVTRFIRSDVLVNLGTFEGIMPQSERVPTEEYTPGERIRALVTAVRDTPKGPEIILSRASTQFVRRLFELECSELSNGTVEIKAMAREAGFRTKIAVTSRQEKVDPVGACVGIRGTRVKNIVRELSNERVDIFRWSDNARELILEALKPAKLKTIELNEGAKHALVMVDAENLSLAIGKRGQNCRLTEKLTGWKIDIRREISDEEKFAAETAKKARAFAAVLKIETDLAQALVELGFTDSNALEDVTVEDIDPLIQASPKMSPDLAEKVRQFIRTRTTQQEAS